MGSNPTSPTKRICLEKYHLPNFAYAIGLVTTDGSLSKDGRHIAFRSSDLQLLETFRRCLNISNRISQSDPKHHKLASKPTYIVQFGDIVLYRFLQTIGLIPAKTYTLGSLNIPDQYFPDFLRGHLDGDGTIMSYQDNYNIYRGRRYSCYRLSVRFLSASQKHIEWLQAQTERLTGCVGAVFDRPPRLKSGVPMWSLKFSKNESAKLVEWMYYAGGLPCLERKLLKVQEARINLASQKRKSYSRI
ncbi:MAG: Intein-containing protein [Berkelbacteria bacterium GW2011_GWA2_46_7]|uniref:Intein-containing protein n=1 Tax=Berkelbacteria bacterium GW2011_GWA2_46_7 TaxID=1618335 RepID=A0A0G1TDN4_9BACT|nr:MAG: Intein-containing protein [Berkelbacteria bacterium GW2011_GWA2_46_7]